MLAMEPLPTPKKVYANVICEERQQQFAQGLEARPFMEATTLKATLSNLPSKPKSSGTRPRCSHCQKLGHEKHQCCEIIGYPPNWQNRRSNHGTSSWNQGPNKFFSHGSRSGQREGRGPNPSYGAQAGSKTGAVNHAFGGCGTNGSGHSEIQRGEGVDDNAQYVGKDVEGQFAGFSTSQVEELFNLFRERQSQERMSAKSFYSQPLQWVLDSGASHHMTPSIHVMSDVYNLA